MDDPFDIRAHLLKLVQGRIICPEDKSYWLQFWTDSGVVNEICQIKDLHSLRDRNLPNFLTLVRVCSEKIVKEARVGVLTPPNYGELLNCVRLLNHLLPFTYELPSYVDKIEEALFWENSYNPSKFIENNHIGSASTLNTSDPIPDNHCILGRELLTVLIELLFTNKFTINGPNWTTNLRLVLWESGIGVASAADLNKVYYTYIANRTDILRLLLTLTSINMYEGVSLVILSGSRFLSFLVVGLPRLAFLSLVSSLFKFLIKVGKPARSRSAIADEIFMELSIACLLLAGQLLALMTAYAMPLNSKVQGVTVQTAHPRNMTRSFFSKFNKPSELRLILSDLVDILYGPLEPASTENGGAIYLSTPLPLCHSVIVLVCELFQCNSGFRSLIVEGTLPKLVVALLYHVFAFHDIPQHSHSVKIASHFLLSLSSQITFVRASILPISKDIIELLPPKFQTRLPISLRDFIIVHVCKILVAITPQSGGKAIRISVSLQEFLSFSLIEIMYNIIPVTNPEMDASSDISLRFSSTNPDGGISYQVCQSLTGLLSLFSSREFLRRAPRNAEMLSMLLRSICSASTKSPQASSCLLLTMVENESMYMAIIDTINQFNGEYFCYESGTLKSLAENEAESLDLAVVEDKDHEPNQELVQDQISVLSPIAIEPSQNLGLQEQENSNSSISLDSSNLALEQHLLAQALRPNGPSGMSSRAKEKLPIHAPLRLTWGGNDAIQVICEILIPNLKSKLSSCWSTRAENRFDKYYLAKQIEHCGFEEIIKHNRQSLTYDMWPDTKVDCLAPSWNELTLGWYMSMLCWDIYTSAELIRTAVRQGKGLVSNFSSSLSYLSRFASSWVGIATAPPNDVSLIEYVKRSLPRSNIWSNTKTKLFEIDIGNANFSLFGIQFGDSLSISVNSLTDTLARRISEFRASSRASVVSAKAGLDEIPELGYPSKRPFSGSIHSLNSLNRVRSIASRNSLST